MQDGRGPDPLGLSRPVAMVLRLLLWHFPPAQRARLPIPDKMSLLPEAGSGKAVGQYIPGWRLRLRMGAAGASRDVLYPPGGKNHIKPNCPKPSSEATEEIPALWWLGWEPEPKAPTPTLGQALGPQALLLLRRLGGYQASNIILSSKTAQHRISKPA